MIRMKFLAIHQLLYTTLRFPSLEIPLSLEHGKEKYMAVSFMILSVTRNFEDCPMLAINIVLADVVQSMNLIGRHFRVGILMKK